MGGRPLTALAIAAFPKDGDRDMLARDLQGRARASSSEAGVALLGGHTVQDTEIKFGYAVTGEVAPVARLVERRRAARATCSPDQAARHRHRLRRR